MNEIKENLFLKLSNKGLISNEIIRVVKDAFNILSQGGRCNVSVINYKFRSLGWQDKLIDEHILNLLIFLFENRDEKDFLSFQKITTKLIVSNCAVDEGAGRLN